MASRALSRGTVLLVTGSLEAGGAERVLTDMANYWAQRGLTVTLATWAGPDCADFYTLDPSVRRAWLDVNPSPRSLPSKLLAYPRRVRRLRRLIQSSNPEVVVSFIDVSNVMTLLACVLLPQRVVVSERVNGAVSATIPWYWRVLRALSYWRADAVVAQTQDAARWIGGWCRGRAAVIPNALRALPEPRAERTPMVLAVGRLTHQKGFDLLLRAFALIAAEFPAWRLVIVGAGPARPQLEAMATTAELSGRVCFQEPVRDVETWMARAGIVVQPSRFEGFPNVVLEAMGMGAAVVSTDCRSGPAEMIRDGVNGCLVAVEDVPALAACMRRLLLDPEARARLGREALKVRQTFAQDRIMREWERIAFDRPAPPAAAAHTH